MFIKIVVILLLAVILYCLGSGVYFLVRDERSSQRLVKALTWRIALSISLFLLLLIAYLLGWIRPHGIYVPPTKKIPGAAYAIYNLKE